MLFTILTLVGLSGTRLAAQNGKYRFSRLDITHGLSHNEVNVLFRDEKGFLWSGTMSGLNRYDGYKFKIFKHDLRDTTSISDDYIERIFEGPRHAHRWTVKLFDAERLFGAVDWNHKYCGARPRRYLSCSR